VPVADTLVLLLIILSIGFEAAFIPWYLIMMVIMWRTIKTSDEGTDHVSIGMFGLLALGLLRCCWMVWHLATTGTSTEQLATGVALDTIRAIVTTYFMWHLRLKDLLREWLNQNDQRSP